VLNRPGSIRRATALLILSTLAPLAFAGGPKLQKLSDELLVPIPSGMVPVIIQYGATPSNADLNQVLAASGSIQTSFGAMKAVRAMVPQSALIGLTQNANLNYISLDRPVSAKQVSKTSAEYTTEPINAPAVWAKGYTGKGIGVAVIDSGINAVPDLQGGFLSPARIVYSQSFVPGQLNDASDHYGHGTHVAGLIAGNGAASTGLIYFRTFSGAAPAANLINLRVLDQNGQGTDSAVIAAIEQAIVLKDKYNIKVINLSVGRPIVESFTLDPLCQAVEQAWRAGIVVVVAAGNDGRDEALNAEGYGTIEAPGNDPYALTVGAVKTMATATITDDRMASYSSKGPTFLDHIAKPDIIAPGNVVTSLLIPGEPLASENSSFVTTYNFYMYFGLPLSSLNYFPLSGTSMSSGVVAGAVADLMQAMPTLTPDQAKAFLMRTANRSYLPATSIATDPTTGTHNDLLTIGAGYLDIAAAITLAQANAAVLPVGTAMSPVTAYDPTQNQVYLLEFPGSLWGTTSGHASAPLTWTASAVYGAQAFGAVTPAAGAVWGWTPIYGASNVTGQPVVAGTAGQSSLWSPTALQSVNDTAAYTALWGNGTPLWGTGTPMSGTGVPYTASGTPLWGTGTPLWGTTTPLWGTGAVGSTGTPLWGTGTPLWGTGTPLWGTSTPLWGTSNPAATGTLWGASVTSGTSSTWGASTPRGTSTPLWGTSIPLEN
jgi:serine protease AprX